MAAVVETGGGVVQEQRNPAHDLLQGGDRLGRRWSVVEKIGGGAFGQIYLAREHGSGMEVGVKVETLSVDRDSLTTEAKVMRACSDSNHFPRFYALGKARADGYAFLVMELLSLNLSELRRQLKGLRFSGNSLRRIGLQCVDALHHLHLRGFVHRDVKPSNWAIGLSPDTCRVVKIIDFGLARRWRNTDGSLKEARSEPGFRGTTRFASVRAHHGLELGRADDLASLFYMLLELGSGGLPWRREKDKELIGRAKDQFTAGQLVTDLIRDDPHTRTVSPSPLLHRPDDTGPPTLLRDDPAAGVRGGAPLHPSQGPPSPPSQPILPPRLGDHRQLPRPPLTPSLLLIPRLYALMWT